MKPMSTVPVESSVRWYRSFYFRIGFSFVVFLAVVIVAQSMMFSYIMARPPARSPNNLAAIVSADIGSALTQDPMLDLVAYLNRDYGRVQPIYLVMKGGDIVANRSAPLSESLRRSVSALLSGTDVNELGSEPGQPGRCHGPIGRRPIRGMVVLPPAPQPGPVARDVGRLVSVPGTALLIVATDRRGGVHFRTGETPSEDAPGRGPAAGAATYARAPTTAGVTRWRSWRRPSTRWPSNWRRATRGFERQTVSAARCWRMFPTS
jgi:hypothetical protein